MYSVCFTGPSRLTEPQEMAVAAMTVEALLGLYEDHPHLLVYVGGALGVDEVVRQRCQAAGVRHKVILPHEAYRKYWDAAGKTDEYSAMVASAIREEGSCIGVEFVYPTDKAFKTSMNLGRNRWMVDHSEELVAFLSSRPDGSLPLRTGWAATIRYAEDKKKPSHRLYIPSAVDAMKEFG